jgi:hypothetical protein
MSISGGHVNCREAALRRTEAELQRGRGNFAWCRVKR